MDKILKFKTNLDFYKLQETLNNDEVITQWEINVCSLHVSFKCRYRHYVHNKALENICRF